MYEARDKAYLEFRLKNQDEHLKMEKSSLLEDAFNAGWAARKKVELERLLKIKTDIIND